MSEQNKQLIRRLFEEVWNQHHLDLLDEIVAPDYPSTADPTAPGPAGVRQFINGYLSSFPDVHFTVDDLVAEGDQVAVRWTAIGTHQGSLMGIPPTNTRVTISGIGQYRFAGGKFVQGWLYFDRLALMQQLGVVPM